MKLLKRQFGLPGDVLSLKSLSLATTASPEKHVDENMELVASKQEDADSLSFRGMHHVLDRHRAAITRMAFAPAGSGHVLLAASMDGRISVIQLSDVQQSGEDSCLLQTLDHDRDSVLDFDLSETGELAVCCTRGGRLTLWQLASGKLLREVRVRDDENSRRDQRSSSFCKFMPQNNNLVAVGVSGVFNGVAGSVKVVNISTGKFLNEGCASVGRSLCAAVASGATTTSAALLWVGNDRGHIESFRAECERAARLKKGCRVTVNSVTPGASVTSLSWHSGGSSGGFLLATVSGANSLSLFSVVDDVGTLVPLMTIDSSSAPSSPLCAAAFAPLPLGASAISAVAAGAEDGSISLLELGRPSPGAAAGAFGAWRHANKLLGHSAPVRALAFCRDERFLATADSTGQIIVWKK